VRGVSGTITSGTGAYVSITGISGIGQHRFFARIFDAGGTGVVGTANFVVEGMRFIRETI
jgi:hypothetical protein